jgi:hypothetical protein
MRLITIRSALLVLTLFSTHLMAVEPSIAWGKAKEGIVVGFSQDTRMHGNGTIIVYACQLTNYMKNLVLPANEFQTLDLVLKGAKEHVIAFTSEGKKYGQNLKTNETRAMKASHHLRRLPRYGVDEPEQIAWFYIDKCFQIDEKADYELEIRVRLLKSTDADSKLIPVIFDPIKSKIHLDPSP